MNPNGFQNKGQPNPNQYRQPQYQPTPQYPQYYGGTPGGYPPQQSYYSPNPSYHRPKKKESIAKKIILLIILLAAILTAVRFYARPIQQLAARYYWQNEWRFVKGRAGNEKEIKKMLEDFADALERKDAGAAAALVHPDKVASYNKMFEAGPDGMPVLASSIREIKGIKMTDEMAVDGVEARMAEVKIVYDNMEYEIQLMKVNDIWYIYNV